MTLAPRATPPGHLGITLLATLAFVVSQAHLAYQLAPLKPSIFALQLAFTPEAFWQVIGQWGEAGVTRYRHHFPADTLHPLLYGLFGYLVVRCTPLFSALTPPWRQGWALSLPVAGLCDWVENTCHWQLLALPTCTDSLLIPLAATASTVKWGLALAFALALAARTLRFMLQR